MSAADGTQWTRPAVQPQDVAEILAAPLSSTRGIYNNTSVQQQQHQPPRHKAASKPPKPNANKKGPLPPFTHTNPLLAKRVWRMNEYLVEFRTRTKGPKTYRPGELPTPIPVPLEYGEKFHEYETRFIQWLGKKHMRLSDLQGDPNYERSQRINFANMHVTNRKTTHATTMAAPPPRLKVSLVDNSSSKPRKRDRSESPPASRKRSF